MTRVKRRRTAVAKKARRGRQKAHPGEPFGKAEAKAALERVRGAVRKVMPRLRAEQITPRARLVADLGIDSLKVAELSLALEDAFGRPVFLGDLFADVEDPSELTVGELARWMARED